MKLSSHSHRRSPSDSFRGRTRRFLSGLTVSVALLGLGACAEAPGFTADGGSDDGGNDDDDGGSTGGGGNDIDLGGMGGDPPVDPVDPTGMCGNGQFEEFEVCDDGNTRGGDGCSSDCRDVDPDFLCIDAGEACIRVVTCGNSLMEGDEVCDDGNDGGGDGCSAGCDEVETGYSCVKPGEPCIELPVCGNGERERGEQCDDGEATPDGGDGCDEACQQEPGYFCPPGEACVPIACGDGNRTPGEQCDDGPGTVGSPGSPVGGDGCSSTCTVEDGWRCSASGCSEICGNSAIDGDEQCDDGNLESGDGCSSACREEPFWTCTGEPSDCDSDIVCGDGEVGPGEVCDWAIAGQEACYNDIDNPGLGCDGFDQGLVDPPVCGNHVIELDEECDGDQGEGCDANCFLEDGFACPKADYCFRVPACGDGLLQSGEECDPGAMSALGCNDCEVDPNYFCSGEPSDCEQSICGDGVRAPDEQCDDGPGTLMAPGTPVSNDGCSSVCTVETGWVCPPGIDCQPVCGDGELEGAEECEEASAACTNCKLNPGYDCDADGLNCFATDCGNGVPEAGEGCDDGNEIAGDGCGPTCQLEPTITRGPGPDYVPVVNVTCGDGLITGSEGCDDGNLTNGDGCDDNCEEEDGWQCQDVIDYPANISFRVTYRDFKQRTLSGGHPHMKEQGIEPPASGGIDADIAGVRCTTSNTSTCGKLDEDGKPVYNQSATNSHIDTASDGFTAAQHASFFGLWYRDTNEDSLTGVNGVISMCPNPPLGETCTGTAVTDTLSLGRVGTTSAYEFTSANFYPLGASQVDAERGYGYTKNPSNLTQDADYGNEPREERNFHFTSELRYFFQYRGGETLTFYGDDDVWVFINGRLAVDLGGIHGQEWGRVVLGDDGAPSGTDSNCSQNGGGSLNALGGCYTTAEQDDPTDGRFGLTEGGVYEIVVFQAERHPTGSNYQLTLEGFIAPRSSCSTDCGDGVRAGSELCDTGDSMPATGYGVCLDNCTFEFCGDGDVTGDEICDNGLNVDVWGSSGCAPGCVEPAYCGDGIVQSAFEVCDDGVNDGSYGGCEPGCQALGPYCGDDNTDAPEEDCDTPGLFANYAAEEGACGFDCKWSGFCGDLTRNGPEICDGSNGCNSLCEFDEFCGDGLLTMGEACDYGDFAFDGDPEDAPYGGCTDECLLGPRCGDEVLHAAEGEECDNGPDNVDGEYNECTEACILGPRCGDAVSQEIFGEACDNGFNDDDYAYDGAIDPCGEGCVDVPYCGDDAVQPAYELCDNGSANNDTAYDGCTTTCEWGPYCGDGETNGSEQCDDGPDNVAYSPDGEGCSYTCTTNVPYCGDGVRNGPEQCDEGTEANTGAYGGCKADCTRAPRCGDRIVQEDEACDDGPSGSAACTQACTVRSIIR